MVPGLVNLEPRQSPISSEMQQVLGAAGLTHYGFARNWISAGLVDTIERY